MANLTSVINVNVPTKVKEQSNIIFNNLGLNTSTAINIFLKRVIYENGIPFELKEVPSKELIESLEEIDDMEKHPDKYKSYKNIKELKRGSIIE